MHLFYRVFVSPLKLHRTESTIRGRDKLVFSIIANSVFLNVKTGCAYQLIC